MKTIHSSTSIPAALFGKQKLKDATKYRLTTHCVQVESEDGTLYFHTMTGAMLLLEQGDLIQEQEKALVADWFLVPIEHDEMKQLRKLRALMHAVQSKNQVADHEEGSGRRRNVERTDGRILRYARPSSRALLHPK